MRINQGTQDAVIKLPYATENGDSWSLLSPRKAYDEQEPISIPR